MSLIQQYLLDVATPPVIAGVWWVFSRGWAAGTQGGHVSSETKKRQRVGFVAVLTLLYLLMFGTTTYLRFAKH
jgi:hypothetical protein